VDRRQGCRRTHHLGADIFRCAADSEYRTGLSKFPW
jgi:hypothetical protein